MKKIFTLIAALALCAGLFAQAGETELFVAANASVDHTWGQFENPEAIWNAQSGTLSIEIKAHSEWQWGNQVFLATGITTLGTNKEYQVSFDIVASTADCSQVTFKAFDDNQIAMANQTIAVTDQVQRWTSEWTKAQAATANGLMVWDFGWDPVRTVTITNISIKERDAQADNPKHDYTITAYLPQFCDKIAAYADSVRVMGSFDNWTDGVWMQKKVDEDFNDYWYAELKDVEEGTEFNLRFGTDADWKVQVQLDGKNLDNMMTGETTDIVLQYDGEGYGFTPCAKIGTDILVHNLTGWDNLYLYMWGDGGNDLGGAWPGFKAQREDEGDLIFLVAEGEYDGKSESLIFNNGNGLQLADYPITLGDSYELWVTLDGVFDAPPAPEYKYTEYENWQIKYGNSWDWSDNMEKVEDGLFRSEILWEGTGFNVKSDENYIMKDWFALEELVIGEEVIAPVIVDVYLKVVDDETVKIGVGVIPDTDPASGPTVDKTGITVNGRKYGFPVRLVKEVK